jgi:hypothetical protein
MRQRTYNQFFSAQALLTPPPRKAAIQSFLTGGLPTRTGIIAQGEGMTTVFIGKILADFLESVKAASD